MPDSKVYIARDYPRLWQLGCFCDAAFAAAVAGDGVRACRREGAYGVGSSSSLPGRQPSGLSQAFLLRFPRRHFGWVPPMFAGGCVGRRMTADK